MTVENGSTHRVGNYDEKDEDTRSFTIHDAAKVRATPKYVFTIVMCMIIIHVLHVGHVIGILYSEYLLMVDIGMDYAPYIYLEAIPSMFMIVLALIPFILTAQWKKWLLGLEGADATDTYPIVLILTSIHSVALSVFGYTCQIILILIMVFIRHVDQQPTGDRCSCYASNVQYLLQTTSASQTYQCSCFIPSLPYYTRKVHLLTDDLTKITPSNLESYTGEELEVTSNNVKVTSYGSLEDYREGFEGYRLNEEFGRVVLVLFGCLVMLVVHLLLWVKVKGLWTDSEKFHLAKDMASDGGFTPLPKLTIRERWWNAFYVSKLMKKIEISYHERKKTEIHMAIDEFTSAFLEGIDAFSLYAELLNMAYVDSGSPALIAGLFFICLDLTVIQWGNGLLALPYYGEKIVAYLRASMNIIINLPFFIIRLYLYVYNSVSVSLLVLVLFLLKEIVLSILGMVDLIHMIYKDRRNNSCCRKSRVEGLH